MGKRRIAMAKLVEIFEGLGHQDVASFIASGNIIFSSRKRKISSIETTASKALNDTLGYEVEVFVRTAEDLIKIGDSKRFEDQESNGATLHVGFMRHALDSGTKAAFEAVKTAEDTFYVVGREFYWVCYTKMSQSKVWELPEARNLDLPSCTLRNISTIRKLVAKFLKTKP